MNHLKDEGIGYFCHWAMSMKYSGKFFTLWITSCIHAFLPNFFERNATKAIIAMHGEIPPVDDSLYNN
jgi:hypothetical protein